MIITCDLKPDHLHKRSLGVGYNDMREELTVFQLYYSVQEARSVCMILQNYK